MDNTDTHRERHTHTQTHTHPCTYTSTHAHIYTYMHADVRPSDAMPSLFALFATESALTLRSVRWRVILSCPWAPSMVGALANRALAFRAELAFRPRAPSF